MTSTPHENSDSASRPLKAWLDGRKLLLGMVHLAPLPGSSTAIARASGRTSREAMDSIVEQALRDARTLLDGGMDGLIVENFGDIPFQATNVAPATVAAMSLVAGRIRSLVDSEFAESDASLTPFLGINVLRNDASAALAIAATCGFHGIRVNVHTGVMASDQGLLEGQAHRTLRERASLGAPVAIFADVLVKHAEPLTSGEPDIAALARDAVERGLADALIISGKATGSPTDQTHIRTVREALPETPLFVGSGVSTSSLASQLADADGAIVGTALKRDGDVRAAVDATRVRDFLRAAGRQ